MSKFITKEGLEKLKEELLYLKTTKQQEIAERLRRAISFGDLSENFDYADAREQQNMVQTRISELEEQILEAEVVSSEKGSSGKIQIGSKVEVESGKEKFTFAIVAGNEANPLEGKISAESPIGSALLGKKKGEKAKVDTPNGVVVYTVIAIE